MACRYLHISLSEEGVRCDNSELVVGVAIMGVDGGGLLVVIFSLGPVLVLLDRVHLTISRQMSFVDSLDTVPGPRDK